MEADSSGSDLAEISAAKEFERAVAEGDWYKWRGPDPPPWWDSAAEYVITVALSRFGSNEEAYHRHVTELAREVFDKKLRSLEANLSLDRAYRAYAFINYCSARATQRYAQTRQGSTLSPGPDLSWENVQIRFLSDERVEIKIRDQTETRNYSELGFEDHRSCKPNGAWVTLRVLAENGGIIRDNARAGRDWMKVEKRMQEIRKALRKHFGISADPVLFITGTGYQAQFKIDRSPSSDT